MHVIRVSKYSVILISTKEMIEDDLQTCATNMTI